MTDDDNNKNLKALKEDNERLKRGITDLEAQVERLEGRTLGAINEENCTLKDDNQRLRDSFKTLSEQNITLNDGIERLRDLGEGDSKVVKTLNEAVADLSTEVERLKAKETKLIDERAHYQELCQLSHGRERQQREKLETVQGLIRLAYKTVKQD